MIEQESLAFDDQCVHMEPKMHCGQWEKKMIDEKQEKDECVSLLFSCVCWVSCPEVSFYVCWHSDEV